ncbi:outer envelope pore protein 24B, chloroplastic-like [Malania oleifera]|uniref:outer envelope pore protein 24B, chloroplastic-like n=1 Tax=Malania oleifera TaxID=397392 RepID=UPI0025ADEA8B|nr:outer envelope pore protein 24B, chloroplastic-like [Malania oleifera]
MNQNQSLPQLLLSLHPKSQRQYSNNPNTASALHGGDHLLQFSAYRFSSPTMHASVKGRCDTEKSGVAGTVAFNAGDIMLRASMTEATFVKGPSLTGLSLSLDKPGSFVIDYNVPKNDARFQFMNTVRVLEKPLNLAYSHVWRENRTALDGTLVLDSANKVSANYAFDSGNCKLKYSYTHGGIRTFEPCYDLVNNSWDFAVSQRLYRDDVFKASYLSSTKVLGLEWSRNSKFNGAFKISAFLNLADELKLPRLSAESSWNFEV